MIRRQIDEHEIPGKRLGRHVLHDPRSRDHAFGAARKVVPIRTVTWRRYGGPFDQGDLGSCTGNAACGVLNTKPAHRVPSRLMTEWDAVAVYGEATALDEFPGVYPPSDTGSSGLAVAKALQRRGAIRAYQHAFGIDETLQALMHGSVITGVDWYEGFDEPDARGRVTLAGQSRGGHEFEVLGLRLGTDRKTYGDAVVTAVNSWGPKWGAAGRFYFTVAEWRVLLERQGDVTILLP